MNKIIRNGFQLGVILTVLSIPALAQQVKRASFDVTNYVMDVSLTPAERKLNATVDVSFTPLEDTRSVSFELNGSLKIDTIVRLDRAASLPVTPPTKSSSKTIPVKAPPQSSITFVQDQSNSSDLGPHVRIDLGDEVVKGTPVVLMHSSRNVLFIVCLI